MKNYLFYPTADAWQDKIYDDTLEKWGAEQAGKYILGLHDYIAKLSQTRALWRTIPESKLIAQVAKDNAFFSQYKRHMVYFKELDSGSIGIISILHAHMDQPARLREDLAKLDNAKNKD